MAEENVHRAKTHLSRLLARMEAGEEIVITRGGKPVARLVPYKKAKRRGAPGMDRGKVEIAPDFDAPLPDEVLKRFHS